jgi:hypothetical protein
MGIHNPDRLDRLDDATRKEIIDAILLSPNSIIAAINELRLNIAQGNQALLDAITRTSISQSSTFTQSPLWTTIPPFSVVFSPGEKKEIIPASDNPRRIIIKSLNGMVRLLLGTSDNIELSAISIETERLIDERWQGQIFGYSADGAEILINIEIENTGEQTEMPIEFKAHCEIATGTNFAYSWLGNGVEKFNSVQGITTSPPISGKALLLDSFQPGTEQIFTLIPPTDTSWLADDPDTEGTEPRFVIRLINPVDLTMAIMSEAWRNFTPIDFKRILQNSITRKVGLTGGATTPIPLSYNSLCLIVTVDTANHGHRGAVFEWENITKTIKILGY